MLPRNVYKKSMLKIRHFHDVNDLKLYMYIITYVPVKLFKSLLEAKSECNICKASSMKVVAALSGKHNHF